MLDIIFRIFHLKDINDKDESLYNFIFSHFWLTSNPRNTVVLLDTGTHGTNYRILSFLLCG